MIQRTGENARKIAQQNSAGQDQKSGQPHSTTLLQADLPKVDLETASITTSRLSHDPQPTPAGEIRVIRAPRRRSARFARRIARESLWPAETPGLRGAGAQSLLHRAIPC